MVVINRACYPGVCGCGCLCFTVSVRESESEWLEVIRLLFNCYQVCEWDRDMGELEAPSFNLLCLTSLLIYLSLYHTFLSFLVISILFFVSSSLTFQFICRALCLPKRSINYSRGVCGNYTDLYNIYRGDVRDSALNLAKQRIILD